jgi:CheY-like chemotaxis protein
MSILLGANLALLAQGYDDTGAASRSSIIIGILAFPCLVVIAVIWQKLKNAKESDKHIERLEKKITELEKSNGTNQPSSPSTRLEETERPIRLIHVDDEEWTLGLVKNLITTHFKNVSIQSFQNSNDAWNELSRTAPDILITDDKMQDLSGEDIVSQLMTRNVSYPIIVTSGLSETENWVNKMTSINSKITFLRIPFEHWRLIEQICQHLGNKLKPNGIIAQTLSAKNTGRPDYREAKYFYEAAKNGDAESQFRLGIAYENGFGVPRSDAEAVKWYLKSAEQGNVEAQSTMGLNYQFGMGVKKDVNEARQWYQKAAAQGDEAAIEQLETKEMKLENIGLDIAPKPLVSSIKHDPQEEDPKLKAMIDAAREEARAKLAAEGFHRKIGYCHLLWGAQKEILLEKYGIDWKSPSEMNRNAFFD